jgi:hypothetical protein
MRLPKLNNVDLQGRGKIYRQGRLQAGISTVVMTDFSSTSN